MKLSVIDFYQMTWDMFSYALAGHEKARVRQFEHTRAICWVMGMINRDPSKNFPDLKTFWPLSTDEDEGENKIQWADEKKAKIRRVEEIIKKRKQEHG